MKNIKNTSGQYVHVYSRGIEKRLIFENDVNRKFFMDRMKRYQIGVNNIPDVQVHAFCLMGNHFHLLLESVSDGGVPRFCHRVLTSYVRFFNKSKNRTGRLFESQYRSVHITTDGQFAHLLRYIHLNPVKHMVKKGEQSRDVLNKAKTYRWSDCGQYLRNSGSLSWIFDDISYSQFLIEGIRWGQNGGHNLVKKWVK